MIRGSDLMPSHNERGWYPVEACDKLDVRFSPKERAIAVAVANGRPRRRIIRVRFDLSETPQYRVLPRPGDMPTPLAVPEGQEPLEAALAFFVQTHKLRELLLRAKVSQPEVAQIPFARLQHAAAHIRHINATCAA